MTAALDSATEVAAKTLQVLVDMRWPDGGLVPTARLTRLVHGEEAGLDERLQTEHALAFLHQQGVVKRQNRDHWLLTNLTRSLELLCRWEEEARQSRQLGPRSRLSPLAHRSCSA